MNQAQKNEALKQVEQAVAGLILNQVFFASLALQLTNVINPHIRTACVDGVRMEINPEYFDSLTVKERIGIVAHETMHCALGHVWRRAGRDIDRWNRACDLEINPILMDAGFKLPGRPLYQARFRNMSVDQIYAILEAEDQEEDGEGDDGQGGADLPEGAEQPESDAPSPGAQQQGDSDDESEDGEGDAPGQPQPGEGEDLSTEADCGTDPGGCGGIRDPRPAPGLQMPSQADIEDLKGKWEIAVEQAAMTARSAGQMTGHIKQIAEENKKSEVDWRAQMRDFMVSKRNTNHNWNRPNRRFLQRGIILPSCGEMALGRVVFLNDVSGSVTQQERNACSGALNDVFVDADPALVDVIYWDTEVKGHKQFTSDDLPITLESIGGGGTDPRSAFAMVDAMEDKPDCVIVLTDLCISAFPPRPAYPVLWVSTMGDHAPFGEVIKLKV